jgi:integrase
MRLPSYLVRSATGVFHFRWMVPKALRESLGRRVIKRSLGTRDARTAQVYALALAARYAAAIQGGQMKKDPHELIASVENLDGGGRRDYSVTVGPAGVSVQTDGTPQDHQGALEAIRALSGVPIAPAAPVAAEGRQADAGSVRLLPLDEAVALFANSLAEGGVRKTEREPKLAACNEFVAHFLAKRGKRPTRAAVSDLHRSDLAAWRDELANPTRLDKKGNRVKKTALSTMQNKFGRLSDFFDWANSAGYFPRFYREEDNPAWGHVTYTKEEKRRNSMTKGWRPFTGPELVRVFNAENLGLLSSDAARWVALMALYTGARSNEVAQLKLTDFYDDEGHTCIAIGYELDGQTKQIIRSVKGVESVRRLPVAPGLVALGLLERVERLRERGEIYLFPRLTHSAKNGPANAPGSSFLRLVRDKLKINEGQTQKVGIHSLRSTVIQHLDGKDVPDRLVRYFTGHANPSDAHVVAYGKAPAASQLVEHVIPHLNWESTGVVSVEKVRPLLHQEVSV